MLRQRPSAEQVIAELWQELMGVGPIGIHDNFFELGGHSLLAIQLTSRIRDAFGMELPLQKIFADLTVAALGESIEQALRATQEDEEELAQLLKRVEQLSESEVKDLLVQQEKLVQEETSNE